MSIQNQTQLTEESNLEKIPHVGNTRRQKLRSEQYVNVGDVANADPNEMFKSLSMSKTTVEKVVNNARELLGIEEEAVVDVETDAGEQFPTADDPDEASTGDVDVPERYQADDEDEPETVGAEAFLDSGPDPIPEPDECSNVLIIAGDGAFDVEGDHGDKTPAEQAKLVSMKLVEYGFTDVDAVSCIAQGMGREAVNSWVEFNHNEGNEIPNLVAPFAIDASGSVGREEFQERNERALEWADGVCVVADGEYVGMWYNMARDSRVAIRTPMTSGEDDE